MISLILEKVAYAPDKRMRLEEIATLLKRKPHNLRPVLKEIVEAGLLLGDMEKFQQTDKEEAHDVDERDPDSQDRSVRVRKEDLEHFIEKIRH